MHLSRILVTLFSIAACAGVSRATTIYTQASPFPGGLLAASQNSGVASSTQLIWDDFRLSNAADINRVTWVGGFYNTSTATVILPISQFTISFYASSGSNPGSQLASFVISGNANQTSLGNGSGSYPNFSYSANLSSTFHANANTTYWIQIVASVPDALTRWGWLETTAGPSQVYFQNSFTSTRLNGTSAFTLEALDAAVPEPGTLVMSGLALLAIGGWRKRRG